MELVGGVVADPVAVLPAVGVELVTFHWMLANCALPRQTRRIAVCVHGREDVPENTT
jgi:hypothetical protein